MKPKRLFNTASAYGWISLLLHWLTALAVLILVPLGLWMVELDYYDEWYKTGPDYHRSIGMLVVAIVLLRLMLRIIQTRPDPLPGQRPYERVLAPWVHVLLLLLLIVIAISGYLLSTADGRAVEVFYWFEVPALISGLPDQEDVAGELHFILAMILCALLALHVLAALKHHFIDRDNTLRRILGLSDSRQ